MVRLTDRPGMTFDVYRGRKTTIQLMRRKGVVCRVQEIHIFNLNDISYIHKQNIQNGVLCVR